MLEVSTILGIGIGIGSDFSCELAGQVVLIGLAAIGVLAILHAMLRP